MTEQDLKNYREIKKEAKYMNEKIKDLKVVMYKVRNSAPKNAPSTQKEQLEDTIIKLETLKNEYIQKVANLSEAAYNIENHLDCIRNPKQREVLRLRYVEALEWKDIEEKMNYSRQELNRLHNSCFDRVLKN